MALHTISLCSGVGGLDLGIDLALGGLRHLCYVEREVAAGRILAQRMEDGALPPAAIWSDLATFDGSRFRGMVDLVSAGFPCPDYSVAGKREGRFGKHGQVWDHVIRIIREVGPGLVVLENVSGILVPHGADDEEWVLPAGLHFVLGDLAESGFDAEWLCLRASDVGAPHRRERWFCIGYMADSKCGNHRGPGWPVWWGRKPSQVEQDYGGMAQSARRGLGVLRKPSGGDGQFDGGNETVDNAQRRRREQPDARQRSVQVTDAGCETVDDASIPRPSGRQPEPGEQGERRWLRQSGGRRDAVAHAIGTGAGDQCGQADGRTGEQDVRQGDGAAGSVRDHSTGGDSADPDDQLIRQQGRGPQGRDGAGSAISIFPPGPGDAAAWRDILERWPWLAPAISIDETDRLGATLEFAKRPKASGEKAQPLLCGVVDGVSPRLDFSTTSRADRLRALGNGCCPLQVCLAIAILVERIAPQHAKS